MGRRILDTMSGQSDERAAAQGITRALERRLEGISDVVQRSHLIREYCEVNEPEIVALSFQAVIESALKGRSRDTWLAIAIALFQESVSYRTLEEIYRCCVEAEHDAARLVLLAGDRARRIAEEGEFSRDDFIENLTLGERKAKARTLEPHVLLRLLQDPNPTVVRILLNNPRMTERPVQRLAAKRPNRTSILTEIALVPRWVCRASIQRALVLNPYSPARITIGLMPLLAAKELNEISQERNLHPMSQPMARTLLRILGWES
ncbi:MAG: hypothetical protein VX938_02325, partial [Myxococcota bacterium]|nr:hypothetical protein [Myxococcota bacterium]